jgi:hypothetical protein
VSARGLARRVLLAGAALASAGCATTKELSFKTITFEKAPRDVVFKACKEVVTSHYYSTRIGVDEPAGRIQTDPVEETLGQEALRQQCFVTVAEEADGRVHVELMATLARLDVDPGRTPPLEWRVYASDRKVEGRLGEEIIGRVLSVLNDAKVVAHTLPPSTEPK